MLDIKKKFYNNWCIIIVQLRLSISWIKNIIAFQKYTYAFAEYDVNIFSQDIKITVLKKYLYNLYIN